MAIRGTTRIFKLNLGTPAVDAGVGDFFEFAIPHATKLTASARVAISEASGWSGSTLKIQESLDQVVWGDKLSFSANGISGTTNICAAHLRGVVTTGTTGSQTPEVTVAVHYQEEV